MMSARRNKISRGCMSNEHKGEGPNWVLVAGGALLSTLPVHLGCKLKQALESRQQRVNATWILKGNKTSDQGILPGCYFHSSTCCCTQCVDGCLRCFRASQGVAELKHQTDDERVFEHDFSVPLFSVPASECNKEDAVIWQSCPECHEQPLRLFLGSASSDSRRDSGSSPDIFTKRGVIQRLWNQLKRRDAMIVEMQAQVVELQKSLNGQLAYSCHLQVLLDAANGGLFDSEFEIQRLRKDIVDQRLGQAAPDNKKPLSVMTWPNEVTNHRTNWFIDRESNNKPLENARIEKLRAEARELKKIIEGKDYLLQSYKEQNSELWVKIKALQQSLDSQLPNIL